MMEDKDIKMIDQYNDLMHGYEQQQFISNVWPLEDGLYRQYSAFDSSGTTISGTSFCI